jgi:hypothetical protein
MWKQRPISGLLPAKLGGETSQPIKIKASTAMAKSSPGEPRDNPPVDSGERPPWHRPAMVLMLFLGAMASAHAQIGGGNGHRQRDQQQTPQKSQAPTPMPAVPEIWPRLEEGALLCKSRDDLVRYQKQNADSASATTAGQASECHTIGRLRVRTGIMTAIGSVTV